MADKPDHVDDRQPAPPPQPPSPTPPAPAPTPPPATGMSVKDAKAAASAEEKRQDKVEKSVDSEVRDSARGPDGLVHDSSSIHGEMTAKSDIAQAWYPAPATTAPAYPSGTQVNPIDDKDPAKKAAETVEKNRA